LQKYILWVGIQYVPKGWDQCLLIDITNQVPKAFCDRHDVIDCQYLVLVLIVLGKMATEFPARQKIDLETTDSLSACLVSILDSLGTQLQLEEAQVGHFHDVASAYVILQHLLKGFQYSQGVDNWNAILVTQTIQELLFLNVTAMVNTGVISQFTTAICSLNHTFRYFNLWFHTRYI